MDYDTCPTLSGTDGFALSVQFVGKPLTEALLCRAGRAFEQNSFGGARNQLCGYQGRKSLNHFALGIPHLEASPRHMMTPLTA